MLCLCVIGRIQVSVVCVSLVGLVRCQCVSLVGLR